MNSFFQLKKIRANEGVKFWEFFRTTSQCCILSRTVKNQEAVTELDPVLQPRTWGKRLQENEEEQRVSPGTPPSAVGKSNHWKTLPPWGFIWFCITGISIQIPFQFYFSISLFLPNTTHEKALPCIAVDLLLPFWGCL